MSWLTDLRDLAPTQPLAMVSILATEGSAPRGPGTRMLVTPAASHGTIGGGALEFQAIEQARSMLSHPPGTWRVQDYPLGPLLGQCCGGRVRLMVEHVDPAALGWLKEAASDRLLITTLEPDAVTRDLGPELLRQPAPPPLPARGPRPEAGAQFAEIIGRRERPLYLFGAGHVGQAVARLAVGLPFRLAWFDTREDLADLPGVTIGEEETLHACIAEAPDEAAIAVLTHDHALDYRLTYAALTRAPLAFIGLIGSSTKKARFLSRFDKDGVTPEQLARLTCPIGLPGVSGKEPEVIALSLLAQLLHLREP
jgi:xanthine dehydrogenase accessory factor